MKSVISVPFARRRSGRTNYRKRLVLLKSNLPRLVVRKTLTSILLQIVDFEDKGDIVRLTASSAMLRKLGWNHSCKNIPAAYLSGLLAGKMALEKKILKAVPDLGLQSITKGGKIFAALKGAKDAGLDIAISEDIAPDSSAISGQRISAYAKVAGKSQFAKAKGNALKISEDFEKLKSAIESGKWRIPKNKES
ncbi:50S ribosomal protein L18 [Candidatus Woesearchaeota archaeon]|nr:50S ribosomal protein L18 [Candidatus Woesearchaeota archaeon]